MRPFLFAVLVLTGCPNWDLERIERCKRLGTNEGVCANVVLDGGEAGGGSATGGGGGATGGGTTGGGTTGGGMTGGGTTGGGTTGGGMTGGGMTGGGGVLVIGSGLPAVHSLSFRVSPNTSPATARFIAEHSGQAVLYESGPGVGFFAWDLQTSFLSGDAPSTSLEGGCGGFVLSSQVACILGPAREVSIDAWAGSTVTNAWTMYPQNFGVQPAVTDFRDFDGGLNIVTIADDGIIDFFAAQPDGGALRTRAFNGSPSATGLNVSEATTTPQNVVGACGTNDQGLAQCLTLTFDNTTTATLVPAFSAVASGTVQVAARANELHAAWVVDGGLAFAEISPNPGQSFAALSEPVELLDFALSPTRRIVLLRTVADRRTVIAMIEDGVAFEPDGKPDVVLDGLLLSMGAAKLRVAGSCDAGTACPLGKGSVVLEFGAAPDGGAW